VRTIKRYANRKLYDTSRSCYVTLDEIAEIVAAGEDVEIIDNTTKENLTAVTLAQILFEAEKRKKRMLPLETLKTLIQSGGEFLEKSITRPVASIRQEAEKRVQSSVDVIHKTRDGAVEKVSSFQSQTQRTLDELQAHVDERINWLSSRIGGDGVNESPLENMHVRLTEIERRLSALESSAKPKRSTGKKK